MEAKMFLFDFGLRNLGNVTSIYPSRMYMIEFFCFLYVSIIVLPFSTLATTKQSRSLAE